MESPTQKNRWIELLEGQKQFSEFLAFIREQKVKKIEIDGIAIEFQEGKFVSHGEPKIDSLPQLTPDQQRKAEEEILYYSAGG